MEYKNGVTDSWSYIEGIVKRTGLKSQGPLMHLS